MSNLFEQISKPQPNLDAFFWRLHVLCLYGEKRIGANEAQKLLKIGRSQFFRTLAQWRAGAISPADYAFRSRPGNNSLPRPLKRKALECIATKYYDHGPTFVSEILDEAHSIKISPSTARRWMIEAGIWVSSRSLRRKFHQPRKRMKAYGQQIQIDGSTHDWFEGRGPKCCVMVFVDDATGKWQLIRFFKVESGMAYIECAKAYLERYGRPVYFVTDKFSAVHSQEHDTPFEAGLAKLNISHTHANSPQSKGRVEARHKVLQDRLVKHFRHAEINSIDQANAVADRFCAKLNRRFALPPPDNANAHRPLPAGVNIDECFAAKVTRRISRQLTFQLRGQRYSIAPSSLTANLAQKLVDVVTWDGQIFVLLKNGRKISTSKC